MSEKPAYVLPYYLSNNGDGSASLNLVPTIQEAEEADEASEESGDCFAEPTAGEIQIFKEKDGRLYVEDWWDGPDGDGWEKRKIYLTVVE